MNVPVMVSACTWQLFNENALGRHIVEIDQGSVEHVLQLNEAKQIPGFVQYRARIGRRIPQSASKHNKKYKICHPITLYI